MKWKTEWTDSILKKREEEQSQLETSIIDADKLTHEMKETLKNHLIEWAKEGNFKKIHKMISIGKASIETRDNNG